MASRALTLIPPLLACLALSGCSPASMPVSKTITAPTIVQQPQLLASDDTQLVMTQWLPPPARLPRCC
ncbi:MAG: hypothetical protein JG718_11785 [Candidatus Thiothrix moscowensis]|nr:hypothetical protein [Candidatus Thiothrix moscowensis]